MFMDTLISGTIGFIPDILYAILVLIIGYLFAVVISNIATKFFVVKVGLDKKIAEFILGDDINTVNTAQWFRKNLFYVLMFYVIISVFNALGIAVVANMIAALGSVLVLIIIVALVFKFDVVGKASDLLKE